MLYLGQLNLQVHVLRKVSLCVSDTDCETLTLAASSPSWLLGSDVVLPLLTIDSGLLVPTVGGDWERASTLDMARLTLPFLDFAITLIFQKVVWEPCVVIV